ncbi:MAG: glutathione peroxidase [Chloroherpetonaceae bacterium]|nr:glutathione peroxidase [Chloroherpetonaceae bacterium]MCS7212374.1 glutathione peroxidase [Chloroherpetonaceae bacterium]MDW8018577.1 glutathione peroxidase [Chloroherpetonaceae bacterium]MDW8467322.1 glutathione peroxidase [Chloroherpetonaceae bacterium]
MTVILISLLTATLSVPSIYDFTLRTIDGVEKSLADYRGKVLLIVNVASECGYTPQYADLEKLYRTYREKGLAVLAFPSNDYGGQEPGSNADIKKFCTTRYGVSFDLFEKISTRGEKKHPLYAYLTSHATPSGEVGWNFEKFLISRDGKIVARFKSSVNPMSQEVIKAVEAELAKK